jgi:phosphoglycolate phosphatase
MAIRGALFDKDGTLISFEMTWGPAIAAVIAALAKGDPDKLAAQAAALEFSLEEQRFLPTSPIIAGSTGHYGPIWAAALGRTDHAELKREIDALSAVESLRSLTPISEPKRIVLELKSLGVSSGVATNDSEASARRQISALGLLEDLDFIVGYDSGYGSKPDPGMIHAFAEKLGVDVGSIAMIGDTLHDMVAARAAGAVAIAVLSGPAGREDLEAAADYVIEDISALPALIAELAA